LASVPSVGVGSVSHCVICHTRMRNLLWPCSICRRGPSQLLSWRARPVMALLWTLVRSVGVGPSSHCGVCHDRMRNLLWPCSLCRRGPRQLLWWRARQVMAVVWTLIRSVGVGPASHYGGGHYRRGRCFGLCSLGRRGQETATVVADTTAEGAALASVPSVGVDSVSHCVGGHEI
jgi:hypothetical protein